MFPYYGSKKKLVKMGVYSEPKHRRIIEPFAGSAAYATYHALKKPGFYKLVICEKSIKTIQVWRYLLSGNPKKILKLPLLHKSDTLNSRKFDHLSATEKKLIAYFINPHNRPNANVVKPGTFSRWNKKNRRNLYDRVKLARMSDWTFIHGDYSKVKNYKATWFVDPPYVPHQNDKEPVGGAYGRGLTHKHIDYAHLAEYCRSRKGQVIVTERVTAKWLPFKKLKSHRGQRKKYDEGVWTKGGSGSLKHSGNSKM